MIHPTKNLSIRPFEATDMFHVKRWFYSGDYPEFFRDMLALTEEQLKIYSYMKDGQGFIAWKGEVPVGFIIIYETRVVAANCKLAILIDKKHQESGLCLEAMIEMAKYIFFRMRMDKLIVECLEDNQRLEKIATEGGFTKEAVLIDEARIANRKVNVIRYVMFKEQFIEIMKKFGGV